MLLTLEQAVNKLCELGLVSRESVEKRQNENRFGKENCFIVKNFIKAVRNDHRPFFSEKPCFKHFDRSARYLFRDGGSREFPPKIPHDNDASTELPRPSRALMKKVDYAEEEDEVQESTPSQAQDYFIKSSQEKKTKGKGTNNPQLARTTKHDLLSLSASGKSIPTIVKMSKFWFEKFFNDGSDDRNRASPSQATVYRINSSLPLANKFQIEEFIKNASRLTLATDGVSFLLIQDFLFTRKRSPFLIKRSKR
jgi:hypothetical protein